MVPHIDHSITANRCIGRSACAAARIVSAGIIGSL
jgi:hypothetical protein